MKHTPRVKIGAAYSNPHFEERLSNGTYRWCGRARRGLTDDGDLIQRIVAPPLTPRASVALARTLRACVGIAVLMAVVYFLGRL